MHPKRKRSMVDFYIENGPSLLGVQTVMWVVLDGVFVATAVKAPSVLSVIVAVGGTLLVGMYVTLAVLVWRRKRASRGDAAPEDVGDPS